MTEHGPPEVLRVQDRPDPEPRPGEVRIRVRAAGVNFADLVARVGLYPDAPKPPCVLGYEVAGEVDAVGEGVDGVSPGDSVLTACRFGGYAELALAQGATVLPLPEGWSYQEAAALPVNYATAYAALHRFGSLVAGERVLLHAAAGGVGIAATQIAKLLGAEVYGTASSSKHDALRAAGVDHPIDYRNADFRAEVRRVAGADQPLDLVVDGIGGRSFRKSFSLLRPGGRLVCIGVSAAQRSDRRSLPRATRTLAEMPRFNPLKLMSGSRSVIGLNLLRLWDAGHSLEDYVRPLREWAGQGRIRPVVAAAFPLERGAEAHRFLHDRKNVGKVVLAV